MLIKTHNRERGGEGRRGASIQELSAPRGSLRAFHTHPSSLGGGERKQEIKSNPTGSLSTTMDLISPTCSRQRLTLLKGTSGAGRSTQINPCYEFLQEETPSRIKYLLYINTIFSPPPPFPLLICISGSFQQSQFAQQEVQGFVFSSWMRRKV